MAENTAFLDVTFRNARSPREFDPVSFDLKILEEIYALAALGPTSANCEPLRITFVTSQAAKEKLISCLTAPQNISRVQQAPVTAIFAYDLRFYDHLPELYPHTDAKSWFAGKEALIEETAFRNSTLQAAYFMVLARAHGLDCGPMSGFNRAKVDNIFFSGSTWHSNFLCALGKGKIRDLLPRDKRLPFATTCQIL